MKKWVLIFIALTGVSYAQRSVMVDENGALVVPTAAAFRSQNDVGAASDDVSSIPVPLAEGGSGSTTADGARTAFNLAEIYLLSVGDFQWEGVDGRVSMMQPDDDPRHGLIMRGGLIGGNVAALESTSGSSALKLMQSGFHTSPALNVNRPAAVPTAPEAGAGIHVYQLGQAPHLKLAGGEVSTRFYNTTDRGFDIEVEGSSVLSYKPASGTVMAQEVTFEKWIDLLEQAVDPAAPPADTARIFTKDSGGDTQLHVMFSDGSTANLAELPPIVAVAMDQARAITPEVHGSVYNLSLQGDHTLTINDPADTTHAVTIHLECTQDATGGRVLTLAGNVSTPGGVAPTLSAAANAIDTLTLIWMGTRWRLSNATFGQVDL